MFDTLSNPPSVFNVGTGKGVTVKEFVQACKKVLPPMPTCAWASHAQPYAQAAALSWPCFILIGVVCCGGQVTGVDIKIVEQRHARPGDYPEMWAVPEKITQETGWSARCGSSNRSSFPS